MKNKIFLLLILVAIASGKVFADPPSDEGKSIFLSRCAACHTVNKISTGPALSGVDQRHTIDWIISFVHSSQSMVKKGDSAALALFTKFNKIAMPDHGDLTNENIKSIVDYIKMESKAVTENKAPFSKPTKQRPFYQPLTIHNYSFFIGYFFVIIALISSLFFAVQLKTFERNKRKDNLSA